MKKLSILAVVVFCMIGCRTKIKVAAGTSVQYENHFMGSKVVVGNPLADVIITKLNDEPNSAQKNISMSLDTRKYLHVGTRTFQVKGHELVLLDNWGVRSWVISNIETKLEVLKNKAPNQLAWFLVASTAYAQGTQWQALNGEVKRLYRAGKYARAVAVAKEALVVAETTAGHDHPSVATSLNNLGGLYCHQGGYVKAEPLFKRALEIDERALGKDPPRVATLLENMALLYGKMGDKAKQRQLEARAREIRAIRR